MSFTLIAYDVLKLSITESIIKEVESKGLDPLKLEESIAKLPSDRRIQATFLLKTIEILDSSKNSLEKARILNAATYFTHQKIAKSYNWVSPERSTFYNSLTSSLDLRKGNQPDRDDLVDMYGPLEKFLSVNVYESGDPRKGYLKKQPFDITGYAVETDIITLSTQVLTWRVEVIQSGKEVRLKELEATKPVSKGFLGLGGIFGGSTPVTEKKVEEVSHTLV